MGDHHDADSRRRRSTITAAVVITSAAAATTAAAAAGITAVVVAVVITAAAVAGHGGGGHGGGGHGGGHHSDIRLKHDIVMLGRLDNGLGFYRFSYNGSDKAYVGVMAQEVQAVMPEAVVRGSDGYLRVYYERLGLRMQTWNEWVAAGRKNSHHPSHTDTGSPIREITS